MDKNELALINLIATAVNDENFVCDDYDFNKLLLLTKKHGVFLTVYNQLTTLTSDYKILSSLKQTYGSLISQSVNQEYYQQMVFDALNNAKVCHLPLKGKRIKDLYPNEHMRFSSDLDVFIKESDKELVDKTMKELGFKFDHFYGDEISYVFPPYVNVEFHVRLDYDSDENYYTDVWQNLEKVSNYGYQFSDNDFYINYILHLFKHFHLSGTGIRSVIDVYLMNKKFILNRKYIETELEKFNLVEFEKQFLLLSKCYFEGESYTPLLTELSDYILSSGIFGTVENRTSSDLSKKTSKFGYLMRRIFPPYGDLIKSYPSLKKCPPLLPIYWLIRIFKSMFFKRKQIKSSISAIKNSNDEKINKQQELFEKLKIKKQK